MAVYTLEELIKGNKNIVVYYNNAHNIWDEIRRGKNFSSVNKLSQELTNRQFQFENKCGGRWLGQEVMVVVGIGQFYSSEIGFDTTLKEALRVRDAFAQSYCSLEVKWHAEKISKIFGLANEDDESFS